MTTMTEGSPLEDQIAQWRQYLRRRRAIHGPDVEELEGHLRDQVATLTGAAHANRPVVSAPYAERSSSSIVGLTATPTRRPSTSGSMTASFTLKYTSPKPFSADPSTKCIR